MKDQRAAWPTVGVILAGGSGQRSGLDYPKQFLRLGGVSVLEHTLLTFERSSLIDHIVIVAPKVWVEETSRIGSACGAEKIDAVVAGGATRNDSTKAAINYLHQAFPDQELKVLIHDAVRPLVDQAILERVIRKLDTADAVDVVIPTADTIVEVAGDSLVGIPDRDHLRRGQTPQGFRLAVLRAAYEKLSSNQLTAFHDDCGVVLAATPAVPIAAVAGSDFNIKITSPVDIQLADRLLQARQLRLDQISPAAGVTGTCVVLGGTSGIGQAIVSRLRGSGTDVIALSRRTGVDVRNEDEIATVLAGVARDQGPIAAVVNTAGVLTTGELTQMGAEEVRRDIEINLVGSLNVARASWSYLRESAGHLLFFTSSSYTRGRAGYSIYCATKAGVVSLTQALADEWSSVGVKVNCINPARTNTPMRVKAFGVEPPSSLLTAEKVADTAAAVLSSTVTGHVFDVRMDDAGG